MIKTWQCALHVRLYMMSYITRSRKYPYRTMDSFLGILKASYNWKSKEMGGYFMIGIFKRCGGGGGEGWVLHCRSGISQGSVKSVFLENAYFMALIRSQIKQKLTTLLATVETDLNIAASSFFFLSSKQPHKLFCSFCFFLVRQLVFWLSIIEAYGIGSNCWPRRLKFKMMK